MKFTPQKTQDFSKDVDGNFHTSIQGILKHWELDSSKFYLHLEDRLREIAKSFNSKIFKPLYQILVHMVAAPSTLFPESRTYVRYKVFTITAVPVNSITKFWILTISTFGALYEADYMNVDSSLRQRQDILDEARC